MDTQIQNQSPKHSKFVIVSIIFAIVVVMNLFFNYAISLVYKEPVYENFVKPAQITGTIKTQEECVKVGGQWNENNYIDENSKIKTAGNCDENFTKQNEYNSAVKVYEKNVFITLVILGVLSLIASAFIHLSILALSFSWGGVLSIIIASMRYWSNADNLLKVIILGVALGTLIWLAVKKFSK
jgi:hypothetical protein